MKKFCLGVLLNLIGLTGCLAQEEDSLSITGIVINLHSDRPLPNCVLSLKQEEAVVARTTTDERGEFELARIPTGVYTLYVKLHGILFYQSDIELGRSADLYISLDTIRVMQLRTVVVNAMKHALGPFQIKSVHDRRLWGFTAGYRDANACIAFAPDAHGNVDATENLDAQTGEAKYGPVFDPRIPGKVVAALVTGKLGTSLLTPPFFERDRKRGR